MASGLQTTMVSLCRYRDYDRVVRYSSEKFFELRENANDAALEIRTT